MRSCASAKERSSSSTSWSIRAMPPRVERALPGRDRSSARFRADELRLQRELDVSGQRLRDRTAVLGLIGELVKGLFVDTGDDAADGQRALRDPRAGDEG